MRQQNVPEPTSPSSSMVAGLGGLGKRPNRLMVTRVGLRFPLAVDYEDWELAGTKLAAFADASAWCLGDWVVFGQHRYTDRYRRAVAAAGLDYQTLRNYAWVARRFELSRRRPELSFQHHAEVAALPEHEQNYWLSQAVRNGWSRNQLRQHVRGQRDGVVKEAAAPQLNVPPELVDRWRAAAREKKCSLESWIVQQLNAAAAETLGCSIPA
nr:LmbU family transcriptional regulator [Kibdelosporangium sp. MJ126-NF4]CTQ98554.1 conserved hypothetical protein present in several antibiotic biosynthetic clusters [Kibdelosporangium sp. MJ126-NF4]